MMAGQKNMPTIAHHGDLATTALIFSRQDADEAEKAIALLAADAIRFWKLEEATFWQRVKFRARLLRAARIGDARSKGEK